MIRADSLQRYGSNMIEAGGQLLIFVRQAETNAEAYKTAAT
jgi:hypothetical protein